MGTMPDDDACYAALSARDRRFDGRFFVGVSSTGIYCRPVCSARTPARRHCRFFPSAAAAERSGMRPCLRCRPELAPGHAAVDARSRLARRAALMIEDRPGRGAAELARRLGVTDRHLRRVFAAEFGVSPLDYAVTQRLLLAKRLLTETAMPVIDVAYASGFASLRRFNAAFAERYRLAPGALRRAVRRDGEAGASAFEVLLAVRPPYDWARLVRFLAARAIEGVEAVVPASARAGAPLHWVRAVRIDGARGAVSGWIEVRMERERHALRARLSPSLAPAVPAALAVVRRVFDVAADPAAIGEALGALAAPRPGLRLPGAVDGFETAVRAVLGQQVSVAAARTLAARFAEAFGDPLPGHARVRRLFPDPARIAVLDPAAVAALGIVGQRARAIVALAQAVARDGLVLSPEADVEATMARLRAVPGIGEWTAQYVAMRALGWPDAFPASDHGVLVAMGLPGGRAVAVSARAAADRAEAWRPWRAYAVMHLWNTLEETVR